jgi:Chaperone of endosialidase/Secretion system C-terminal sorting domain
MKRFLFTVYATVILGCFFGKAQTSTNNGAIGTANPTTSPTNISVFEARGRLITQNFQPTPAGIQVTGNFGTTARWNSMGSLNAGSQILNGFRTQTDGRGLAMGYSVPTAGTVSNPTIQWIGNAAGASVTPGNLEFKYALNPGSPGVPAGDANIFTMASASGTIPSFNYATTNALVGQLQSGAFGSFGVGDSWSATGQITTPSFTTYGARQQYIGNTLSTGFLNDGASISTVMDFGFNINAITNPPLKTFKFRTFTDPTSPSTVRNIWQSSVKYGNVLMSRQDINSSNSSNFYLSVLDGGSSLASATATSFIDRSAIYATGDGRNIDAVGGPSSLSSFAAITGDVSEAQATINANYAILGITSLSRLRFQDFAGYFVGNIGYTGGMVALSDRRFKTEINNEESILTKLMQLKPKNYFFDTEKNKNMALSDKLQHGLISQEVEEVFPELIQDAYAPVTTNNEKENGKPMSYKGLNYMGFIPMLIKAVQELKIENDELRNQIKSSTNTFVINDNTNLPAEIENKAFTLSQNTPNPFSEKTTISYTIPSNVKKATLAVFDLTGKMLLQYNLKQGKNNLQIDGNTLAAGMYLYSLLADGQEVLSKRMVLTK